MPRNLVISDIRPTASVEDTKSKLGDVLDTKTKILVSKTYSGAENPNAVTLSKGSPIGLLLSLTYAERVNLTDKSINPLMFSALDKKSRLNKPFGETIIYTDPFSYSAGQPMGLLLSLTYPADASGTKIRN